MATLLAGAQRGSFAVCYCESWILESFQAVAEAVEEEASPLIAGLNGGFDIPSIANIVAATKRVVWLSEGIEP